MRVVHVPAADAQVGLVQASVAVVPPAASGDVEVLLVGQVGLDGRRDAAVLEEVPAGGGAGGGLRPPSGRDEGGKAPCCRPARALPLVLVLRPGRLLLLLLLLGGGGSREVVGRQLSQVELLGAIRG